MKNFIISLWHRFIYKPGTKRLYWEKIISSIVMLTAFIVWAYFNQTNVNGLKSKRIKYAKYTIGVTTGSHNNVKGGRTIDYNYFMGGKKFSNWDSWPLLNSNVITNGGHYFVRVDSTNYNNAEMLFKCLAPENIKDMPVNGWITKPIECDDSK